MRQIEAPWVGGPPDPDDHCNVVVQDEDEDEGEGLHGCRDDGERCDCDCLGCRRARADEHDSDARDYDADLRLDAMRNGDMDEGAWE